MPQASGRWQTESDGFHRAGAKPWKDCGKRNESEACFLMMCHAKKEVCPHTVLKICSKTDRIGGMKAIITVVGGDKVGIIAKVSAYLAAHSINIADITQTILSGNFVMMMMVEFDNADIDIDGARKDLTAEAEKLGVEVNVMAEKVFTSMHRI